ncbi:Vacuolar protein sorting-associated protein 35B [Vitis vinifera]|uniref:Vacuolar protein sorting-associated protein 35B n=1 Tax=Vitis vinifera TaxID=29760 RepID=A0A438E440_VITVI|nr:Vacuolar protein sorting-associated protein 35B [Vitis vinifera]
MPVVGAITLYVSLLTFTLRVHPDRLDYVDQVLGACVKKLSGKPKLEDSKATKQIVALLSAPLEKYNDIVTALTLSNYPRVMDHLDNGTNKIMAMVIIQSIMKNSTCISTADKVEALFELIKGLIKDLDGFPVDELDEEDFKDEQNSVARLIHMFYNDDPEEMLKVKGFFCHKFYLSQVSIWESLAFDKRKYFFSTELNMLGGRGDWGQVSLIQIRLY